MYAHLAFGADDDGPHFANATDRQKGYKNSRLFYNNSRFLDPLFLVSQLQAELRAGAAPAAARKFVAQELLRAFVAHPWSAHVARELHQEAYFGDACEELSALLNALQQPDVADSLASLQASTDVYPRTIELRSPYAARSRELFDWWHQPGHHERYPALHTLYVTVVAMMPSNCAMERKISSWRELVTLQQSSSTDATFETMCILNTNEKSRKSEEVFARKGTIVEPNVRKRKRNPASNAQGTRALQAEVAENMDRVRSVAAVAAAPAATPLGKPLPPARSSTR